MSSPPRPTFVQGGILIHAAIWPQQTWAENWGLCPIFGEGAGSLSNTKSPGLRPTSIPSGILMHPTIWHNRYGPKIGGLCPNFEEGGVGPHLTRYRLGCGLLPCQVVSSSMQPCGHNRYGSKTGGCAPVAEGELGPHLTQCGQGRVLPACAVSS